MFPDGRCRRILRNLAMKRSLHGRRLACAMREQNNLPCFENSADAHCYGAPWNLGWGKVARCVGSCFRRETDRPRAGRKSRTGLIKSDMAVRADADDQQVDTAGVMNGLLVPIAFGLAVDIRAAVRNIDVPGQNIDVVEKMPLHVGVIAFRMFR